VHTYVILHVMLFGCTFVSFYHVQKIGEVGNLVIIYKFNKYKNYYY